MKNGIIIIVLLVSGFAFSQTTINLENQCNCEVIKGTDVTAPGVTFYPADLGDIYINTDTGILYFWDGDSWELTSGNIVTNKEFEVDTENKQLVITDSDGGQVHVSFDEIADAIDKDEQQLSFDNSTNVLFLENGGDVDLSLLEESSEIAAVQSDVDANEAAATNAIAAVQSDVDTNKAAADAGILANTNALAAHESADKDLSATNEIQTLTSTDGSITVTPDSEGKDYDFSIDLSGVNTDDQALSLSGNDLTLEDGGTVDLTPFLDNTDDQTITAFSLNDTTNELKLTLEDGGSETVDFSTVLAAAGTDDQIASEVDYSNSTSGLTAENTQAAIDELAASNAADGDTDDENEIQALTSTDGSVVATKDADNNYDLSVDASSTQFTSSEGLTATDVQSAIDEVAAGSSDDQTASEVDYSNGTSGLTAENTQAAIDELAASNAADGDTDDENELNTTFGVNGTNLELVDAGGTLQVALSDLGSDDQTASEVNVTAISGITSTDVQGVLEELNTNSTDDQTASEVDYSNSTSGLTAENTQAAIDELAASNAADGDTDDENELNTTFGVNGTNLELVDAGGTLQVALSDLGSDDQTASEVNVTTISGITSTDVQGVLEELNTNSTDDQTASEVDYSNSTSGLTAGNTQAAIDELAASNAADGDTDDENEIQALTSTDGSVVATKDADNNYDLSVDASSTQFTSSEGLTATDVQSAIDEVAAGSSDDQTASEVDYSNGTSGLTAENTQAAIDELAASNAADGDTDDENELNTTFGVNGTNLELVDAGGTLQVALSDLGSDDQTASEVDYSNSTSGLTAENTQAAIDELAASNAADGDTDDENELNTTFGVNGTNLELVDAGGTLQVALSDLGSDDQTASEVDYSNGTSGLTAENTQAAIDELAASNAADGDTDDENEIQTLTSTDGSVVATKDADNNYDLSVDASSTQFTSSEGLTATDVQSAIDEVAAGSSDDQTASEVDYSNSTSGLTAEDTQAAIDELAASNAADGDIDDENELNTTFGVNGTNLELVDAGGTLQVALSDLGSDDQTASEVNVTAISGITSTDVQGVLEELNTNSTDDQTASEVDYSNSTSGLTAENTQAAIDELAASNAADGDTDDENELNTTFGVNGTNLELVDAGGTLQVALSDLGSDNQTASEVNVTAISGITSTDVQGVLEELNTNSTDDQTASEVDYSNGTSGLTAGNTQAAIDELAASNAADGDTDDENELNTTFGVNGTNLELVDAGGTLQVALSDLGSDDQTASEVNVTTISGITSTDVQGVLEELNTNSTDDQTASEVDYSNSTSGLTAGNTQAAIDELAASNAADGDTDDENEIQALTSTDGSVVATKDADNNYDLSVDASSTQFTSSEGLTATDVQSAIDEVAAGSSDDQTASEVDYSNGTSGLTAENTQAAIDELAASNAADGDTDDENELNTTFGVNGTNLELVDAGGTLQVALSDLGSDDQTASEVDYSNSTSGLTAENTQAAIDELAASNAADGDTDDENELNTTFGVNGTNLELVDAGGTLQVALSDLGSDDQTASEVDYSNGTSGLTAENTQAAIDELAASNAADGDTDDENEIQTLTSTDGSVVATKDADNNYDLSVDASSTQFTSSEGLTATDVQSAIDEVAAGSSDDQTASEVDYSNSTSGLTAEDTQAAIDELAASNAADGDIDDENELNTTFGVNGTNLELVDAGGTLQVALSDLGSDDQTASEVDYSNSTSGLTAENTQAAIDELAASNAADGDIDDENELNTTFGVNGTNLELVDAGGTLQVALADLGSDDQTASEVDYSNGTSGLTAENTQAAIDELAASNAADGDTDDENELNTTFGVNGTNLELVDVGGTLQVALSDLGSDDQTASEVNVTAISGITSTDVQGVLEELNTNSTDDQTASEVDYSNGTSGLTAENTQAAIDELAASNAADGDTDDENELNTTFGVNGTNLELVDAGGTLQVALSDLGSDDQTASEVDYSNSTSGLTAENTQAAIDELAASNAADGDTDDENELNTTFGVNGTNLELVDAGGTLQVALSDLGSDDQTASEVNVTAISGITSTDVQGVLEELNTNSTDDQTASEVDYSNGTSGLTAENTQAAIDELAASNAADGDTDDENEIQTLTSTDGSVVATKDADNNYDLSVDASSTQFTSSEGLTATDVQSAIDEVAAGSSDDQTASEVDLDTELDVDGDGTNETNTNEAITAMSKVTAKAARIFYPPSIAIDASSPSGDIKTLNLYEQYINQFATPAVSSTGAPTFIPTYSDTDLYYYVTEYDTSVFTIIGIDANGVMSYTVDNSPEDYNSLINVVFVVK
ncbi:hypothetical protein [Galbibacter sp. BG1]